MEGVPRACTAWAALAERPGIPAATNCGGRMFGFWPDMMMDWLYWVGKLPTTMDTKAERRRTTEQRGGGREVMDCLHGTSRRTGASSVGNLGDIKPSIRRCNVETG